MKLRCSCGWEWEYKGDKEYYATCPNCLNKVKIDKKEVNSDVQEKEVSDMGRIPGEK